MLYFYIMLFSLFFLSGCGGPKKTAISVDSLAKKERPVLSQFRIEVEGVECAICAQEVADMLSSIEGISMVAFVPTKDDYQEGYFHFCYDLRKGNIDFVTLNELCIQQGFKLNWMSGYFNIKPLENLTVPMIMYNDRNTLPVGVAQSNKDARSKAQAFVQGKIVRQANTDEFIFNYV